MRVVLSSLAVVLVQFAVVGCGEAGTTDPRTEAPLVRVAVVQKANSTSRSFTGTVGARAESDLGFRVAGKVLQRFVDSGQAVRRGQPLMRIDATDYKLAADAQDDAVDAARARVDQADEQADHYRDLRDSGKISDEEYDASKAEKSAAKAALEAAKSQADIARNSSGYTELVAAADGVVEATLAEPGQVVAAGQTVVRVATGGQREAVIQLPETLRPEIGAKARASLYGQEDDPVSATLRQLSDSADPLTRTFEARYVLSGELADAPLGSTVTIDLPDEVGARDGLRVPVGAVLDTGSGSGVWVVDDASKVAWLPVEIRRVDDDSMYVSGDLNPGDRVVALGAQLMRAGERVRVDQSHAVRSGVRP